MLEDAWRAIESETYKFCLVYWYHQKRKPGFICRELKIHSSKFDRTLRLARATLRNLTERRNT